MNETKIVEMVLLRSKATVRETKTTYAVPVAPEITWGGVFIDVWERDGVARKAQVVWRVGDISHWRPMREGDAIRDIGYDLNIAIGLLSTANAVAVLQAEADSQKRESIPKTEKVEDEA